MNKKNDYLSSTVLRVVLSAGVLAGGAITLADISFAGLRAAPENPAAVARPGAQDRPIRLAASDAKKACNPCNPCAAKKACNPCAAKKACNPCNPCAAKKACNPCAAKKSCNPCNPCGAKKACNPCAAKKSCNPCNPCAAKKACNPCNPCNPCAGGAAGAASAKCMVPRLVTAALCNPCAAKKACNPCNPCAAKKACNPCAAKKACNPCNPCAAKKACNPCNPCAAKKACNPCNPCAAKKACNPCNPCNPCGAAVEPPELTATEANSVYDCLKAELTAGYAKSGRRDAGTYVGWDLYNTQPYLSDSHGLRFVNNYANAQARNYGKFEDAGLMAVGARIAKDSFTVQPNGRVSPGPLFMMEKMPAGFNKASHNWKYSMIMPNGQLFGETGGKNSAAMRFCYECHSVSFPDTDNLFFLPLDYRKN